MTNVFGGDDTPQTLQTQPAVTPPPVMPDPQSPDSIAARRKAEQSALGRAGRSSTILSTAMSRSASSGGTDTGTYGAAKLGSGA